MRGIVAAIIGGVVMFVWGAVAHMMLPIGEMGMKVPTEQATTIAALGSSTQGTGVYMYPSPPKEDWQDEAKMKAFAEKITPIIAKHLAAAQKVQAQMQKDGLLP